MNARREEATVKMIEEARGRLAELAPLLEEAGLLRRILAVLDPDAPSREPLSEAPHVPVRKARILAIVGENPGITAAQISDRYGMKRNVVASSISRLKRSGEIVARSGGVRLPESAPE